MIFGPIFWTMLLYVIYNAIFRLFSLFLFGAGSQSKFIVVCVLFRDDFKTAL